MSLGALVTLIYGVIAIGGGIMGYVTARSKMSLISGIICGSLLITSGVLILQGVIWSLLLAMIVTTILVITMIVRYIKTRKFMPAGLIGTLGVIALIIMVQQSGLIG